MNTYLIHVIYYYKKILNFIELAIYLKFGFRSK